MKGIAKGTARSVMRDLIYVRAQRITDTPVVCASGEVTNNYLDLPGLFNSGGRLSLVAQAFREHVEDVLPKLGIPHYLSIGGMEKGADPFAHALALSYGTGWFSIRKTLKDHGLPLRFDGQQLDSDSSVMLIDDVVSSGGSLGDAFTLVKATGAQVKAIIPLVDRGTKASIVFAGLPYFPMFTYRDFGLEPL